MTELVRLLNEKEKEFKKKHVVKKSGENPDGSVTKEAKSKEEAASPEEKAQLALKQAKEKPWLYTEEELLYMKRQLALSKRALERKRAERSKGFKNAS